MLIRAEHSVIVCFFCAFFWERPGRQFWWDSVQILCPKCSSFLRISRSFVSVAWKQQQHMFSFCHLHFLMCIGVWF